MKKILLVEDEVFLQNDIKKLLEDKKYKVVDRVHTGEAALSSFRRHNPEIIIMDIHLKGKMNGIDVAKEIVQFADPYFIFLAGSGYEEYLKGTGIKYEYLIRPFSNEQVLKMLEGVKG